MFRKLTICVVVAGILTIGHVFMVYAQDASPVLEAENLDLIIDEALNEVEKSLNGDDSDDSDDLSFGESVIVEDLKVIENLETVKDSQSGEDPQVAMVEPLETKIIPLLYAEAAGLIETLDQMKSPIGEVTYNEEDHTLILKDTSQSLEAMATFVKETDILLETEIFLLEHVKAQDIFGDVESVLTKDIGQAQFDERANSIVVTDTPSKIGEIKGLVGQLDRINTEVLFEVKILEIVLNDEHAEGVDWEAIVSDHQELLFTGFAVGAGTQYESPLSFGTVSQEDYDILLEALDMVGVVDVISEETVKAKHEKTADVIVQNEGMQFHLTPTVGKDETLAISVAPGLVQESGNSSLKTPGKNVTIRVKNGATIVIGSLFKEVTVESMWKVPLLGDLPLLGFVFRNQGEELRRAEIITFLVVKIVEKKE